MTAPSAVYSTSLGATPIAKDANYSEKSPLLSPNKRCSAQVECENVSADSENASNQHLAKDFQLIHVPKGAVSATDCLYQNCV